MYSNDYLHAAFRPTEEVCAVPTIARQRDLHLAKQASWAQRMQKAPVQMNIQCLAGRDHGARIDAARMFRLQPA
jgi:hypothetical protein